MPLDVALLVMKRMPPGTRVLVAVVALLAGAGAAWAQERGVRVVAQGVVGSHLRDGGNSQALSVGLAAGPHLEFLLSGERSHVPTKVTRFDDGFSVSRHGTVTFMSGEVRFLPATFGRAAPYALAGAGRGRSRLNVNEHFPDPVTNSATQLFAGGGVRVALTRQLSVVGDVRLVLQSERGELGAFAPVRAGVAWKF